MTNSELLLMIEALHWKNRYEESNPDVGMGSSLEYLLQSICIETHINPTVREVAEIIGLYRMKYGRR